MTQTKIEVSAIDVAAAYERALPLAEYWKLADPALVKAYQNLLVWRPEYDRWQERRRTEQEYDTKPPAFHYKGSRDCPSPDIYRRYVEVALRECEVDAAKRVTDGDICVLAFEEPRRLETPTVRLPEQLVAHARLISWRVGKIRTGGMVFIECRVLRRDDLEASAGPKPNYLDVARACDALWAEDGGWLGEDRTLSMIADELIARDGRFARMAPATLEQYISRARKETRTAAGR